MKLKFFLMATAAMTLATSCSSDAVVEDQQAANAIQFGVTTGNASRAASYYCNNDKPDQFNVWAKVKQQGDVFKTYFEDESYTRKTGATTWTITSGIERYWPNEEVSFYAAKNHDKDGAEFAVVNWNNGTPTIAFTAEKPVKVNASEQQDLLYAYTVTSKTGSMVEGTKNKAVANLNFRHALSQVVFKAQNKNKNIYVEISEVQVANLKTTGTFTFPTNVTDDKSLNDKHQQTGVIADNDPSFGKWSGLGTTAAETTTGEFTAVPVLGDGVLVNLTNNEGTATGEGAEKLNEKANIIKSLIVLPQELGPAAYDQTNKWGDKAYFKVKCLVKNVAKGDGSKATADDVTLYDKYIYIPVNINWQVGKKYIYTFVFSEKGHAGYDEKGNDVLIPIEFNVTVDDFAKGVDANVDADNGNA